MLFTTSLFGMYSVCRVDWSSRGVLVAWCFRTLLGGCGDCCQARGVRVLARFLVVCCCGCARVAGSALEMARRSFVHPAGGALRALDRGAVFPSCDGIGWDLVIICRFCRLFLSFAGGSLMAAGRRFC